MNGYWKLTIFNMNPPIIISNQNGSHYVITSPFIFEDILCKHIIFIVNENWILFEIVFNVNIEGNGDNEFDIYYYSILCVDCGLIECITWIEEKKANENSISFRCHFDWWNCWDINFFKFFSSTFYIRTYYLHIINHDLNWAAHWFMIWFRNHYPSGVCTSLSIVILVVVSRIHLKFASVHECIYE